VTTGRALPRVLIDALRPALAKCYRHCDRPVRAHRIPSPLPGILEVFACPTGVVSVTSYAEWSNLDPTSRVSAQLRSRTVPPALLKRRDLRLATRHGPELGRSAERLLARSYPARPVRVVYWRLYPFRGRDGAERRLFVCRRHGTRAPVFFASRAKGNGGDCPACARAKRAAHRRSRASG
jgi:hypothetical protein